MNGSIEEVMSLGGRPFCDVHSRIHDIQGKTGKWGHRHQHDGRDWWCVTTWATSTEEGK